jgi:hypothetical protein
VGCLCGVQFITDKGTKSEILGHKGHAAAFLAPKKFYIAGIGGQYVAGGFSGMCVLAVDGTRYAEAKSSLESRLQGVVSRPVFRDNLVRTMLKWFKGGFFKWVVVKCDKCGADTTGIGTAKPTFQEAK